MEPPITYEVTVPASAYQVLPGLPQSLRRHDHTVTVQTRTLPLPTEPGSVPLLVFVNGLGPYPPGTYQVRDQTFTLLAHDLHAHDHVTLLF